MSDNPCFVRFRSYRNYAWEEYGTIVNLSRVVACEYKEGLTSTEVTFVFEGGLEKTYWVDEETKNKMLEMIGGSVIESSFKPPTGDDDWRQ